MNKYLAEGLECKELLSNRNKTVRLQKSIIHDLDSIVVKKTIQQELLKGQLRSYEADLAICQGDLRVTSIDRDKYKRKVVRNRWVIVLESILVATLIIVK